MDSTIEKVKKLLALANGTPYEKEAQAAMLKAQEILLKAGLDMADIDFNNQVEKKIIKYKRVDDFETTREWKFAVANPICQNFRVTLIRHVQPNTLRPGNRFDIILVGVEEDVVICKEVLEFAFNSFEKSSNMFVDSWYNQVGCKRNTQKTMSIKNDYTKGYVYGLFDKFREQVKTMALVLVQDPSVKKYLDTNMDLTLDEKKRMKLSAGSMEAWEKGRRDGSSLDHSGVRKAAGDVRELS